jgi:hypothetical protein
MRRYAGEMNVAGGASAAFTNTTTMLAADGTPIVVDPAPLATSAAAGGASFQHPPTQPPGAPSIGHSIPGDGNAGESAALRFLCMMWPCFHRLVRNCRCPLMHAGMRVFNVNPPLMQVQATTNQHPWLTTIQHPWVTTTQYPDRPQTLDTTQKKPAGWILVRWPLQSNQQPPTTAAQHLTAMATPSCHPLRPSLATVADLVMGTVVDIAMGTVADMAMGTEAVSTGWRRSRGGWRRRRPTRRRGQWQQQPRQRQRPHRHRHRHRHRHQRLSGLWASRTRTARSAPHTIDSAAAPLPSRLPPRLPSRLPSLYRLACRPFTVSSAAILSLCRLDILSRLLPFRLVGCRLICCCLVCCCRVWRHPCGASSCVPRPPTRLILSHA